MLYHEVNGNGPVLLLIPGGNGDAGFYAPLVKALADRFTVISYDRRGFSRSAADGAVTADRLNSDCDDARGLIELVTAAPAYVFGSSSGAIVAMQLLGRHSECVRAVVAHEPPVVRLLPDSAHWLELFDDIYDIYRNKGARPAMRRFVAAAGVGPPRLGSREFWQMLRLMPRLRRNMPFWLEHELRQIHWLPTRYPRAPNTFEPAAAGRRTRLASLVSSSRHHGTGEDTRDHSRRFSRRPRGIPLPCRGVRGLFVVCLCRVSGRAHADLEESLLKRRRDEQSVCAARRQADVGRQ